MRYNVGATALFIHVHFDGRTWGRELYMPWLHSNLRITVKAMECVEHHKVLPHFADANEEPTCDGFIFRDADGNTWENQYPRASYGQLDDSGDWRVHRIEDDRLLVMQDATKFLDSIYRALEPGMFAAHFTDDQRRDMTEYLKTVIAHIEMAAPVTVARRPIILQRIGEAPEASAVHHTVLVPTADAKVAFTKSQLFDSHGMDDKAIADSVRASKLRAKIVEKVSRDPVDGPHFNALNNWQASDMYIRTVAFTTAHEYVRLREAPVGRRTYEVVCHNANMRAYFDNERDAQMVVDLMQGIAKHPTTMVFHGIP